MGGSTDEAMPCEMEQYKNNEAREGGGHVARAEPSIRQHTDQLTAAT